jgi:hypothetical protein
MAVIPAARADMDPVQAVTQIENAVAEAQRHLSPSARMAHEGEINQALANIRQLAENFSHAKADGEQADANVVNRNADVQAVNDEISRLQAQFDSEGDPLDREKKDLEAQQQQWNMTYGGRSFQVPEPYNSLNAQRTRIANAINDINARIEAFNQKYLAASQKLASRKAARVQDYRDAVRARDQLNQSLQAQAQQFQVAIQDLTDKLMGWIKASPAPAPGSTFDFNSGTLDQLMKASNQRYPMSSANYEASKDASDVVFDRAGGTGGTLKILTRNGSASAPVEMQQNQAIHALVNSLDAAQNAVNNAQQRWNEVIHDRNSTPIQIQAADKMLTAATANLIQLKYEERVATDLLGQKAPTAK